LWAAIEQIAALFSFMIADIKGCQIAYDVRGDGDPLLLLHGGMGAGADWKYVFPTDPSGFRVIVPDLRGHGASTNPSGAFTFRQAALDILALLDRIGVEKVKAIGLSGGGITLLHMATLQPARIESMVVVSAPPYFPAQARAIQAKFSEEMLSENERQAMRRRHVHGEDQIRMLVEQTRGFAANVDDVNFTPPLLSTITADTLIVFGDRDFLYPVSIAFELSAAIPRSFLWIVPNGPHGPIFGPHTPAFVATATAFLRGDWRTR
jgi:pimeloyl-ACP methyl ester carboxylesterase